MSFTPFLGGKRICLGKTFAETVTTLTIPLIMSQFDLEFVNKEQELDKTEYNIALAAQPECPMRWNLKN